MSEKKTANMVLSRTRRNQIYLPYMRKKPYFDAISRGDDETIAALSQKNYEYPTALYNRCGSYSEAMEKMYYEAVCAAAEMCLAAIQAGLLDMVAYDIRDEFIKEFDNAVSLPDLYDLVHGMAHSYAVKMKYIIREKKYSPRLVKMMTYIEEHLTEKIELAEKHERRQHYQHRGTAVSGAAQRAGVYLIHGVNDKEGCDITQQQCAVSYDFRL